MHITHRCTMQMACRAKTNGLPAEFYASKYQQRMKYAYLLHIMCGYQCDKAMTKNDTREVI